MFNIHQNHFTQAVRQESSSHACLILKDFIISMTIFMIRMTVSVQLVRSRFNPIPMSLRLL